MSGSTRRDRPHLHRMRRCHAEPCPQDPTERCHGPDHRRRNREGSARPTGGLGHGLHQFGQAGAVRGILRTTANMDADDYRDGLVRTLTAVLLDPTADEAPKARSHGVNLSW